MYFYTGLARGTMPTLSSHLARVNNSEWYPAQLRGSHSPTSKILTSLSHQYRKELFKEPPQHTKANQFWKIYLFLSKHIQDDNGKTCWNTSPLLKVGEKRVLNAVPFFSSFSAFVSTHTHTHLLLEGYTVGMHSPIIIALQVWR